MKYLFALFVFMPTAFADMMVIPGSINFFNVRVGSTGYQSVSVYNNGQEAIQISTTDYCYGDFYVTNWCMLTLRPGASCNIDVRFQPRTAGIRNCSITLRDSESDYKSVHVSGTGRDN